MMGGVDDPLVLPNQFLSRISGNLAERVVHMGDATRDVGGRHESKSTSGEYRTRLSGITWL